MTRITLQYFFIFCSSRAISFLPASSDHFFEALVNAFFLEAPLWTSQWRGRAGPVSRRPPGTPGRGAEQAVLGDRAGGASSPRRTSGGWTGRGREHPTAGHGRAEGGHRRGKKNNHVQC